MHPAGDPWGELFGIDFYPDRAAVAGTPICKCAETGILWRAVLEGIQSDQDFLRLMLSLSRTASHQLHCHFCDSIQWVSRRSEIGPLNNAENLYTIFGPREGDAQNLAIDICCVLIRSHKSHLNFSVGNMCGSHASGIEILFFHAGVQG